jgi:hypothetical protein
MSRRTPFMVLWQSAQRLVADYNTRLGQERSGAATWLGYDRPLDHDIWPGRLQMTDAASRRLLPLF